MDREAAYWYLEKDAVNVWSQRTHTILGYIGFIINMIAVFVVAKSQPAIQKTIGIIAFADIAQCVKEILDSAPRLVAMAQTPEGKLWYHDEKVPRILCLWSLTFHVDMIQTAFQQPATVALAFERCYAVFAPIDYNQRWKKGLERRMIFGLMLYSSVLMVAMYIYAIVAGDVLINIKCSTPLEVGHWFPVTYVYNEKAIYSFIAAVMTAIAVVKGKSSLKKFGVEDAKVQQSMTRTAVIIVGINSVLVIGPTIARYLTPDEEAYTKSALYSLMLTNSVINFPVMLVTSSDVRIKTKKALAGLYGTTNAKKVGTQVTTRQ